MGMPTQKQRTYKNTLFKKLSPLFFYINDHL